MSKRCPFYVLIISALRLPICYSLGGGKRAEGGRAPVKVFSRFNFGPLSGCWVAAEGVKHLPFNLEVTTDAIFL